MDPKLLTKGEVLQETFEGDLAQIQLEIEKKILS